MPMTRLLVRSALLQACFLAPFARADWEGAQTFTLACHGSPAVLWLDHLSDARARVGLQRMGKRTGEGPVRSLPARPGCGLEAGGEKSRELIGAGETVRILVLAQEGVSLEAWFTLEPAPGTGPGVLGAFTCHLDPAPGAAGGLRLAPCPFLNTFDLVAQGDHLDLVRLEAPRAEAHRSLPEALATVQRDLAGAQAGLVSALGQMSRSIHFRKMILECQLKLQTLEGRKPGEGEAELEAILQEAPGLKQDLDRTVSSLKQEMAMLGRSLKGSAKALGGLATPPGVGAGAPFASAAPRTPRTRTAVREARGRLEELWEEYQAIHDSFYLPAIGRHSPDADGTAQILARAQEMKRAREERKRRVEPEAPVDQATRERRRALEIRAEHLEHKAFLRALRREATSGRGPDEPRAGGGAGAGAGAEIQPALAVHWSPEATSELDKLDPGAADALRACIVSVRVDGLRVSSQRRRIKHLKDSGPLLEIRPKGAAASWRALFRIHGDSLVILAITPEFHSNKREFNQACKQAIGRFQAFLRDRKA